LDHWDVESASVVFFRPFKNTAPILKDAIEPGLDWRLAPRRWHLIPADLTCRVWDLSPSLAPTEPWKSSTFIM
jgi:hypothetical protein